MTKTIGEVIRGYVDFLVRDAGLYSMAETAAKQMEAYFLVGFRPEITEDIRFKDILISLLPSDDQALAASVLEGMVWRFLTGEQEIPKYKKEKEELEGLNVSDKLWQAGYGKKIEALLRNFMKEKLSGKVDDPGKLKGIVDTILYKEKGELEGSELGYYNKIKKEMTPYLGELIKNQLKISAQYVIRRERDKAPEEVLEPSQEDFERGMKREKISPDWLGFEGIDMEEINKFVEKNFPSYQYKIFENLVYGNPPMSETALVEKIKKEDGKEVTRRDLNRIKFKVLDEIKGRFFPGVPQKKPVDVTDIKWTELKDDQAKDFEEFLDDYLEDTRTKEGTKDKIKLFLRELMKGGKFKEIAQKIDVNESSLKQYSSTIIKPAYEAWIKEQVKKTASGRLLMAMEEHLMAPIDYDVIAAEEKTPKALKFKDEDVEALEKMIQDQILDKKDFDVLITFVSDYDWVDVGLGKKSPELYEGDDKDKEEGWVKDDPQFAWKTFNSTINKSRKRGKQELKVDYTFKLKLFDTGDPHGEPASHLKMIRDTGDVKEPALHDAGIEKIRVFLDNFFMKIAEGEVPILSGTGISVKYKNEKLDREYHNTVEFENQMGGLGLSNSKHSQRAKEYELFRKKRRMHLLGPGRNIAPETEWKELETFFTKHLKSKGLSSEDRAKVQHYLELLKKYKSKVDPLKLHEMVQFEKKHWEDDHAQKLKEVDPMDALK